MILDKLLEFDPAGTPLTVSAASTNIIDLHSANMIPAAAALPGRDLGAGQSASGTPKIMAIVTTALLAAGAATLVVQVQGAPDNGAGAPGAYVTMAESQAIPKAALVIGARLLDIDMPRPAPGQGVPRFIRLNYVVGTGPFTAGAIQAELVLERGDNNIYYPAGTAVSN